MEPRARPHYEFGQLLTEGITKFALAQGKSVGVGQRQLAEKLAYSNNALHVWRRGEHLPGVEVVEKLAREFVQSWQADQQWINRFLEKGEYGPALARTALIEELFGEASEKTGGQNIAERKLEIAPAPATGMGVSFFIEAFTHWSETFFQWSKAPAHMQLSWAGKSIYALSALGSKITPGGALFVLIPLALGLVAIWLMVPILRWPLDESTTRQIAFLKYSLATLLIPLLVAIVTRPDQYDEFRPLGFKQHTRLWFLKFTGALVGFYTFSMFMIGLTLIWYYISGGPFYVSLAGVLAVVPLFWSYVTARRIPADRYKMFKGELRAHSVDYLFAGVFLVMGPLSAFFLYFFYWFLSDRGLAPVSLLLILIGIALWESKKQKGNDLSDITLILFWGFFIPFCTLLLTFFLTPPSTFPSTAELLQLLLVSAYVLGWTLVAATLLVRNKLTLTLSGVLSLLGVMIAALLTLRFNLWLGRAFVIVVILVWILWGRKWFRPYFWLHPSGWAIQAAIGVSLYLWGSALIPLWANLALFIFIATLLVRWAYRVDPPGP